MFYVEYRAEVQDHKKGIEDKARQSRKQLAMKANKTKEELMQERVTEIKSCEYDEMPSEKQKLCIDEENCKVSLLQT